MQPNSVFSHRAKSAAAADFISRSFSWGKSFLLAFSMAAALQIQSVQAESWNGTSTGSWTYAASWTPNAIPTLTDTALFDSTNYTNQPTLAANTPEAVLGLQFGDGTTAAGVLTIGSLATAGANQKTSGSNL